MTGTLYGLGVGPGDPDLITVKARQILATAPVIAYPAPAGGTSLVRAIADPHVPADRLEIAIETPMAVERHPAQAVYDHYADVLGAHLAAGSDVALLCEGDPFLYGSFMYLYERLAPRFPAQVVPGVTSLAAVAAVAGRPLVARNDVLMVLPGTLAETDLERRLALADAAAIMKVGRHLPKIRRVLNRLGLTEHACYVARATMADQRIAPLHTVDDDSAPYFSTILVNRSATRTPAAKDTAALPEGAAVIVLGPSAMATATRIKARLPGAALHGRAERVDGADIAFDDTIPHLQALFQSGTPIIGLCAAGILIRALAPMLGDKRAEPPVLAVAEDGSAVVPLLGGHHGANRLARSVADTLNGVAAVTTAGDVRFGIALDDPPEGWTVTNPAAAKAITAARLAGEPVALTVQSGDAGWLAGGGFAEATTKTHYHVRVTDQRPNPEDLATLVLHPPVLALGVGCARNTPAGEVIDLAHATLARHGLAEEAVACVVSLDLKADEAAVHGLADALGVPARFFSAERLEQERPRLANPSEVVFREVGCHGVAEGAALAAAGPDAALIVPKLRTAQATCAIARSPTAIDGRRVGQPRGRLMIVGLGPGDDAFRTTDAARALAEATDVVGYDLYVDLVQHHLAGKAIHRSPLTAERDRARLALDLAAAGKVVALLGSGDAGIYGLATLVFELLEAEDRPAWNRVAVDVHPGVSAFQMAAARIGAPVGHDFCLISLSDLMTPWPVIAARLEAAARGDFVVALYNPVSQRRRTQLAEARDLLLAQRPPDTPVVLARNLGRAGERVEVIHLADLTPDHADMLTLVLIGARGTRRIERGGRTWIYTPRGYRVGATDNAETATMPAGAAAP